VATNRLTWEWNLTSYSIIGGTGDLGGALARRLAAVGREIIIGSRDPAKAAASAAELAKEFPKAKISGLGIADAGAAADICFVTVPYAAQPGTLEQLRDAVQGKILVDATVPLKPPAVGKVQLPASGSAVVDGAAILGEGVRVVSALQNVGAEKLAAGGDIDADVLVAGDDAEAVEVVRALLAEIGLRSWHVGPLPNSAAAEALTSLLIQLNRRYKLGQAGIKITGKAKALEAAPSLSVTGVPGLPMFGQGDDLPALVADGIVAAGLGLQDDDVLVFAQKVVSKVEGRVVKLTSVEPSPSAREAGAKAGKDPALVHLIESESTEIMRVAPNVVIARHRTGQVLANAGIDASNITHEDGEQALLWPVEPDTSATRLRTALERRFGVRLAVVISDSLGRAWRMGTTGQAIGVSGMKPIRDRRGETDLFGRTLVSTVIGVADEIAAAASLVLGEAAEGIPVAIVRGARYDRDEAAGLGEMIRPIEEDLFR
jgi:coenzyme F420-0:L-glutamate ligase/NADPH-dependent F420 reductase